LRQGWRAGRRWCLANGVVAGGGFALTGLKDNTTLCPVIEAPPRASENPAPHKQKYPNYFKFTTILTCVFLQKKYIYIIKKNHPTTQ
ncbi:hypothetical protein, partial [Enterobacter hormaechei]